MLQKWARQTMTAMHIKYTFVVDAENTIYLVYVTIGSIDNAVGNNMHYNLVCLLLHKRMQE